MTDKTLTFVFSYRDPFYGRFRALLESALFLPERNVQLLQNTNPGVVRYWQTFWKLLFRKHRGGAYLLGFRGYEFYWLLRLLVGNRPILVDALVSPTLRLQSENSSKLLKSLLPIVTWLEKMIYANAQLVIVDTESHRQAFLETFSLSPEKVRVLSVGAEERVFSPAKQAARSAFTVLYYFSGQRLHGIEQLAELIKAGEKHHIHFILVGPLAHQFASRKNVSTYASILYHLLPQLIAHADLCLVGPFANTPQAQRVITTKTFQCLAMKKPIVVGRNQETLNIFSDKENALVVPLSNGKALREAVVWASQHPELLGKIAAQGYRTYQQQFSTRSRAKNLESILQYVENRA